MKKIIIIFAFLLAFSPINDGRAQNIDLGGILGGVLGNIVGSQIAQAEFDKAVENYNAGNYKAAFATFKNFADQDHAESQFMVGLMYQNGQGVEQSFRYAERYYAAAANNGSAEAANALQGLAEAKKEADIAEEKARAERQQAEEEADAKANAEKRDRERKANSKKLAEFIITEHIARVPQE